MKIIVLNTVHYISHGGITLSQYNPFVEATTENIEKLSKFIHAGYLAIKEEKEATKEEITPEPIPDVVNENVEEQKKEIEKVLESVKRGYDFEDLKDKTKNQLIKIAKEEGLPFKNTMKKEELIDILVG